MASVSTAVDLGRVSAVAGYEVAASLENLKPGFLNQRIAILGQKETAFEGSTVSKLSATSASEVAAEYGHKSMLYAIARILRPVLGGNKLGSIETIFIPVAEPAGGTAATDSIAISGTVNKTKTHYLKINGRTSLDGSSYGFVVEIGDTPTQIAQKMIDAANNVLGCPVTGTLAVADALFTAGWKGESSSELNISVDTDGDAAGLTYVKTHTDGAGAVSVTDALAEYGDEWFTMTINGFSADSDVLNALEAFNGNANDKTGRYDATIFKPMVSFFGDNTVDTLAEATSLTDARKNEMTNVLCPAPNSLGWSFEAPANVVLLYAPIAQSNPHKDPIGLLYSDMPTSENIGDFADVNKRDQIIKVGSSTVKLNGTKYEIVDLVTTSHPDNEPQTAILFRWVRDLVGLDWNVKYKYALLEEVFVKGKTIIGDDANVSATDTISPKRWKSILLTKFAPDLIDNALMATYEVFKESLQVQVGESNPNRFETSFIDQRTGVVRISSTTNNTQFYFKI